MRNFALSCLLAATALSLSACDSTSSSGGAGKAAEKTAAPAGKTWTQTVVKTAEEGFLMGNPDAAVKLIEYGSLVCGHCADFSKASAEPIKKYIDSGQVSFEFRNFLLSTAGPIDAMASAVMHCAGPDKFYPLKENFFASQKDIFASLGTIDQAAAAAAEKLPVETRFVEFAKVTKLSDWFKTRGVPETEVNACLTKVDNLQAREKATNEGVKKYNITGTPTFLLNGKVLEGNTWSVIEAKLKEAGATG